jgi:hypothetical protein
MLALEEYEAGICEGCGHDLAETIPPASEPEDWTVLPPLRCSVCTLLAIEQDGYVEAKTKHVHALRWRVTRKRKR